MGSAIDLDEIKRFELTEVWAHPEAKVDIILVHGLNGDPRRTWTSDKKVFWPTDLLPVTLKSAKARILVYGYNADVYAFGKGAGASSDMLHQHAQTLLANVAAERQSEEATDHAILWVAHSLGGLLVKRALNLSDDLESKYADELRSIAVSTFGIIFLGTPHTGADPAKWGVMVEKMVSALIPKRAVHTESQLVETLRTNNETLQNVNLKFMEIYDKYRIDMVHEAVPTDIGGSKTFIVDQLQASPQLQGVVYYGIEATHSGMCKFNSKNSPGYSNVAGHLKGWVEQAPPVIQNRQQEEREKRRLDYEKATKDLRYAFHPPQVPTGSAAPTPVLDSPNSMNNSSIIVKPTSVSIEPEEEQLENSQIFVKPSGFRPNYIFVGREAQLADIHKKVFDKRRRAQGTSAVLIQSLPGGGKTYLAREYVFEHKDDFPGGIFWLRAKSATELAAEYWKIYTKAVLRNTKDKKDMIALQDCDEFIKKVKKWLNRRENWLMVLDGMHFDDAEHFRKFIPDGKNTALIYTSTEKSASSDHHFMNPQIIRLPQLSAREAQRLLLLELDRKEPFSTDDLKQANLLVQTIGFLPVVIHFVAQRLKATGEPLSRFAKTYADKPSLRGLGAYTAVVEELKDHGSIEALNLIKILCFFKEHIPVEMISLGVKSLDIDVKATDPSTGHSLNTTFKHLNMFALIDRNEHEEAMEASQDSRSTQNMLADNIDVIRLHSVVQGFFVDTLAADGTLPHWLDRAARVFCASYDHANARITRKTHSGLVEDYRVYETHGVRLQTHLRRYRKKYAELKEAHDTIEQYLEAIQAEIERRTPESSQTIAVGRPDAFQTSIFDRTSSSSDADPETPGGDKVLSNQSTWGIDPEKGPHESPVSVTHPELLRPITTTYPHGAAQDYLQLPAVEDDGYESDREGTAMTVQPSQRTVKPDTPISPPGIWETVNYKSRRPKRVQGLDASHRTIDRMSRTSYSDRAGSYRSVSAIDPRLSNETASGVMHRSTSRAQSRGRSRISGRSSAEVALTSISKSSPPPARGGGMIQDRRPSRPTLQRSRFTAGTPSYAAAVAGATTVPIPAYTEAPRLVPMELVEGSGNSTSDGDNRSQISAAREALQRFPVMVVPHPADPNVPLTLMPPYPPTPGPGPGPGPSLDLASPLAFPQPYLTSDPVLYNTSPGYSQENLPLASATVPTNIYPRMPGTVPIETQDLSTSPLKRSLPHDYPAWDSQMYPEQMSTSLQLPPMSRNASPPPGFMSLSSPNILLPHPNSSIRAPLYFPGRPELSFSSIPPIAADGYTSQPMSRDPSSQSRHAPRQDRDSRKPSLAETEPLPQVPFSPSIPPTSYQVYEQMRERDQIEEFQRAQREPGYPVRKSPRLESARAALIEQRLDSSNGAAVLKENIPPLPRPFNPAAPSFSPSTSILARSPIIPAVPNNSNASSYYPSPAIPPIPSSYSSPIPNVHAFTPPLAYTTPRSFSNTNDVAPAMGRSGSGGVKIGGKIIEFGEMPVDMGAARQRVERSWVERENSQPLGLGIRRA